MGAVPYCEISPELFMVVQPDKFSSPGFHPSHVVSEVVTSLMKKLIIRAISRVMRAIKNTSDNADYGSKGVQ